MGDSVETVLGELSATQLGPTQIHEHVLVDCRSPDPAQHMAFEPLSLSNYYDARYSDDHQGALLLDSVEDAAHELRCFAEVGGRTIVDVTPSDLGRRPGGLREVARLTDVNILMGCGFYVHEYHAPEVHDLPVEALSEIILRDCLEGVAVTGPEGQSETVKAGVIGEIGLSWPLDRVRAEGARRRLTGAAGELEGARHPSGTASGRALRGRRDRRRLRRRPGTGGHEPRGPDRRRPGDHRAARAYGGVRRVRPVWS